MRKVIVTGIAMMMALTWASAAPADSTAAQAPASSSSTGDSLKDQLTNIKGAVDGIKEDYLATKSTVDKLSKIKISGYTQVQFRAAMNYKDAARQNITDTAGMRKSVGVGAYYFPVGDFAGGKIGTGIGSLLQIRRARIKVAYETDLTQGVIQTDFLPFTMANALGTSTSITNAKDTTGGRKFDTSVTMTQKPTGYLSGGGVSIKDVYLRFTEPWLKLFAIKFGVYNRPFGFEISQSSGDRESPERSRTEQTLFPGERDLGASLEMLPGDNSPAWLQYFNFKGGVFTGNGINVESDNQRDLIGRFGISCPFKDIGLGIDAGASGYFGKVTDWNDAFYSFNKDSKTFTKYTGMFDSALTRKYYGGDVQLYYSLPVVGGLTLRGEVYKGIQPGTSGSSSSLAGPNALVVDLNNTSAIYSRNFLGYYAMWVQNIDPLRSQFVLKYDSYDPNSDIKGDEIDSAKVVGGLVSPADLMFNTIGVGWVYHWDENIKFMAYLDIPQNETVSNMVGSTFFSTNSKGTAFWPYLTNMKASVFTFRIQYKF